MPSYVSHNADGSQLGVFLDVTHHMLLPALEDGWVWTECPFAPGAVTVEIVDGTPTVVSIARPADVVLAEAKAARWADALAYRNARQEGGCTTTFGRVQTDAAISQGRIVAMALSASIKKAAGEPWSVNWTMADNSVVALDADQMIEMGAEVAAYIAACQDAGTAIRTLIDNAADIASLAAVDITTDYPS